MKRRRITVQKQNYTKNNRIRPIMEISPINRNFPNDDLVVKKFSVNYEKNKNAQKTRKFPFNTEDLILLGIILLLYMNRENQNKNQDCNNIDIPDDEKEGFFSIERIKKIFPIDKLSDNDILMMIMVYLLI